MNSLIMHFNDYLWDDIIQDEEDFEELAVMIAFPMERRVIRKRPDHFDVWNDSAFIDRFRLSKEAANFVLDLIRDEISSPTTRNHALTAEQRLLLTLRFYATGCFLSVCGDFAVNRQLSIAIKVTDLSAKMKKFQFSREQWLALSTLAL